MKGQAMATIGFILQVVGGVLIAGGLGLLLAVASGK